MRVSNMCKAHSLTSVVVLPLLTVNGALVPLNERSSQPKHPARVVYSVYFTDNADNYSPRILSPIYVLII